MTLSLITVCFYMICFIGRLLHSHPLTDTDPSCAPFCVSDWSTREALQRGACEQPPLGGEGISGVCEEQHDEVSNTAMIPPLSEHLDEKRQGATVTTSFPAVGLSNMVSFTGTPTPLPFGVNTSDPAVATFVPPPKTDTTPALIQQSLNEQPQSTATIIGATPYFKAGIISFAVQLQGTICNLVTMNASTTIPCGTIGQTPGPALVVVPYNIKNGTAQVTLESCLVIAINMYDSSFFTYWVQRPDGKLFSVLSDNKVHDLDKINTALPAQADILTTDVLNKRGTDQNLPRIRMRSPDQILQKRGGGLEDVDDYTATMTPEACRAMTCNNNDGKRALFNPFQRTCYCQILDGVNVDPDGESVGQIGS